MQLYRDYFSWFGGKGAQYRCLDWYYGFNIKIYVHVLLKIL